MLMEAINHNNSNNNNKINVKNTEVDIKIYSQMT